MFNIHVEYFTNVSVCSVQCCCCSKENIHKTVDIFYVCNMGLLNVVVSKVY